MWYVAAAGILVLFGFIGRVESALAQVYVPSARHQATHLLAPDGLYFAGEKGRDFHFGARITPHGDCLEVMDSFLYLTWYRGGMERRQVMLSRLDLRNDAAGFTTIAFPDRHIGFRGDSTIGDSHNTIAVGVSPRDGRVHLLYDMHAYRRTSYPDHFFNYRISDAGIAFGPDSTFRLTRFSRKLNYLRAGGNYERSTYPGFRTDANGQLVATYRFGGAGNGNLLQATYREGQWSESALFSEGMHPLPKRHNIYGKARMIGDRLVLGGVVRYTERPHHVHNQGLYFAYANTPYGPTDWYRADGTRFSLPIRDPEPLKLASPCEDYGIDDPCAISWGPEYTLTPAGAIHFIIRVDDQDVHYYRAAGETVFQHDNGDDVPSVYGSGFSIGETFYMVALQNRRLVISATPAGRNTWRTLYQATEGPKLMHFNARVAGNRLYVYAMQEGQGDQRPLVVEVFALSST